MSNVKTHAENELSLLEKTVKDAIISPFKEEIIALCEAVGKSGQSGGSNPYTASALAQAIEKLLNFQTICPITGEDSEWTDVSDINEGETDVMKYQNKRDSRIFKQKDGRAYFIDAIVFDGDIGGRFTGNGSVTIAGETISSCQYIKSFPFTPKTFYVDVLDQRWTSKDEKERSPDGDWWTHIIKDSSQLKEVFEYYDKFIK